MIKRRFYRLDHSNRDDPSGSSSSSSDDSEVEGDAIDETDIEEDDDYEVEEDDDEEGNIGSDDKEKGEASSSSASSGYKGEDSSANEVNLDSTGLPTSDDDMTAQDSMQNGGGDSLLATVKQSLKKDETLFDSTGFVLKRKSVFKCKLCPKIICLSEETLKAHLNSKGHARSEKLHKEGRLKFMLNDDGKIEAQTHSDDPDTTPVPLQQQSAKAKKKRKGPSKQKGSGQETKLGKRRPSNKKRERKEKREKRRKND